MMKSASKTGFASLAMLCGLGWLVVACPASLDDRCAEGACVSATTPSEGGPMPDGGGADVVQPPPGCDVAAEPTSAPLCVVDDYAIFVAPDGKADALGGKASPVNSITTALTKVGNKPRIYVCNGAYVDKIDITKSVSIYGGFECGTWMAASARPQIEAPAAGDVVFKVDAVAGAVLLSRLEFAAKPGSTQATSSIAAFINASPHVTFRGSKMTARLAESGADGAVGTTGSLLPPVTDLNGGVPETAGVGKGGLAKMCSCSTGGISKGGRGGDLTGTIDGEDGQSKMMPSMPLTATGLASTQAMCNATGVVGQTGSNAPPGADALTADSVGVVSSNGWTPTDGPDGDAGKPGQGGGGAGSKSAGGSPGGGGGGACGGCGGSIAVLALNSPITFETSELVAMDAGHGGRGRSGGTGVIGGIGGTRAGSCSGGDGGRGGDGGAGAGGSGGLSVGVLHKNGAPAIDAATDGATTIGAFGAKGLGGNSTANDGKAGDAKKVIAL
jgi:hypothetical protein